MAVYRPRLNFVRANPVRRKMVVRTEDGEITAEKGDYVVIFPNDARTVLQKDFFEATYELADVDFCDVCLDFDGVLHSFESGWQGVHKIPDPPVPGAFDFIESLLDATSLLTVAVYSARSAQGGIPAMQRWFVKHGGEKLLTQLIFPFHKPAAKVYLDDRGLRFEGEFPSVDELKHSFRTWNDSQKKGKLYLLNNGGRNGK